MSNGYGNNRQTEKETIPGLKLPFGTIINIDDLTKQQQHIVDMAYSITDFPLWYTIDD